MPASTYQERVQLFQSKSAALKKKLSTLSAFRLLSFVAFLVSGYYFFKVGHTWLLLACLGCFVLFLYLIRYYDRVQRQFQLSKGLAAINQTELNLLNGEKSPYENGESFINPQHPYSYDLDLFGPSSLFQFLNRTTTQFGKEKLKDDLLTSQPASIRERQQAIEELKNNLDFRQDLQASGTIHLSEEKKLKSLQRWLTAAPAFESKNHYYLLWFFPLATIVLLLLFLFTEDKRFSTFMGLGFVINLAITFSFARKMADYIAISTDINKTLQQFSEQISLIEQQSFQASLLRSLQSAYKNESFKSSVEIARLATLFNYLDFLFNIFVSPLLNGFLLFHIHILFRLDEWRKLHGNRVNRWLEIIGETESLGSFANMAFNNPGFSFPEQTENESLKADDLGHPLIAAPKRITNSISFNEQRFVILTGSNMSGKSTFLRTLGINLVLARAGSTVCASKMQFYPFDIFVSMRINDSLQDSESLFYAELKRLHSIIEHLRAGNRTFIILDEILRGTNSNDKHNGTIGLIRKLIQGSATGIIATHDLTVADLSAQYPEALRNKCFESAIIQDELTFDYKIKDGVCSKLSASFLMQKMGIIDKQP